MPCDLRQSRSGGKLRPRRAGVTVVEFALTFPLLLLLVIGLIEFSRLSTMRHAGDNAAYEAARHVIVPGANVAEAIAQANDLLARSGIRQSSISVTPAVIDEDTEFVTVEVRLPLKGNSWLPPQLTANRTVVRDTTLRTERVTMIAGTATTRAIPASVPPTGPPSRARTGGGNTTRNRQSGTRTDRRSGGGSRDGGGSRSGGGRTSGGGGRTSGGGGGSTGGGGGSSSGGGSTGGSGGGSSSGGGGGGAIQL